MRRARCDQAQSFFRKAVARLLLRSSFLSCPRTLPDECHPVRIPPNLPSNASLDIYLTRDCTSSLTNIQRAVQVLQQIPPGLPVSCSYRFLLGLALLAPSILAGKTQSGCLYTKPNRAYDFDPSITLLFFHHRTPFYHTIIWTSTTVIKLILIWYVAYEPCLIFATFIYLALSFDRLKSCTTL